MVRKVFLVILVLVVLGALGGASLILYQRKVENQNMDRLRMAETMLDSKEYDNAIKQLLPVVQYGKRFKEADYALYLLAQAYEGSNLKEAVELWRRLAEDFEGSPYAMEARLRQAESLLDSNPSQARTLYQELVTSSKGSVHDRALIGVARSYDRENKIDQARKLYYDIIRSVTDYTYTSMAKDRLSEINTHLLWSPVLDEFCQLYTVERGDAVVKIGQRFKTTAWFIEEANHIRAALIHPGKRLKVPKEPFHIVIDKQRCRLELRTESGTFIKWYPVGVGEQSYKTPAGEYEIINKEKNPTWYKPGGGIVRPNDPENALGIRWMGIGKEPGVRTGLGIHGTNDPDTIGKPMSAGCIRMYNEDVEELYKIVTYGTRVTIEDGTENH